MIVPHLFWHKESPPHLVSKSNFLSKLSRHSRISQRAETSHKRRATADISIHAKDDISQPGHLCGLLCTWWCPKAGHISAKLFKTWQVSVRSQQIRARFARSLSMQNETRSFACFAQLLMGIMLLFLLTVKQLKDTKTNTLQQQQCFSVMYLDDSKLFCWKLAF